ncbi:amidase [Belnapia rosea]|uniref:amidase n=1 Tax=Belnapia rosea TaxID=938405 RepID=UPI0008874768|nr:amidase family protein [Belnapia rosea]SDB74073.1 aspartyl-tRNA(Asn)/glutamyl-tRNA(Gln) amidotransferase subunit A [Belnapia rosea]
MSGNDLCFTPAVELAADIRRKRLSPVDLMAAVLHRIEAHEPAINAFATLLPEQAMAAARLAESSAARGEIAGPLHGVPITIKDLTSVRGVPMESGSWTRKGLVPDVDAPLVTRLRDAGAIILGKTTTSEFGWAGVSRSPLTGITHNPWRQGYNAGASSAGAGAAAAAGFGPLHQGSDGAGSIRMPAHFCGVFGLKPSYGRVPQHPVSTGDLTSHAGPMTRSVADAALMLKVMSGPHSWDFTSLEGSPADYLGRIGEGIAGKRIAFSPDLGHARVDPEVAEIVRSAVDDFGKGFGLPIEAVVPAWGPAGPEIGRFFWTAHMSRHEALLEEWGQRLDPGLAACVRAGAGITMPAYQMMRERKYAYIRDIHVFFENWDFLLTPAVSVPAFPAEQLQPSDWPQHAWDWLAWAEFSYPFNMSGSPAASVPCGFTRDGLPVGLQIIGRRFDDLGVLQTAAAFEALCPWSDKRPPLPS